MNRVKSNLINYRTPELGFTLLELLVVISIIALLAALLMPTLASSQSGSKRMGCLANLKEFGVALHLYAGDNADRLPPNMDGRNATLTNNWVMGWLGQPGPDCTNTLLLRFSLLGRYLGDPKLWQCPASTMPIMVAGVSQPRVRTLSLNCFMGSPIKSPAATTYTRLADIVQPPPAEALTFIGERVDTINDGSFGMQWPFNEARPVSWVLRDKPEIVHNRSGNLTFADGHVITHRWQDRRTLSAPRNDAFMPSDADVLWLQQHATHR